MCVYAGGESLMCLYGWKFHPSPLAPLYPRILGCLIGNFTPAPWYPFIQGVWNIWLEAFPQLPGISVYKESGMLGGKVSSPLP